MQTGKFRRKIGLALKLGSACIAIAFSTVEALAQDVGDPPLSARQEELSQANKRENSTSQKKGGDGDILVTGTHISGVETPSPTYTITLEQIRQNGQVDLGEALRSLPFNFNGGQNPGVVQGVTGNNGNQTNGSSPNLRGLGPDATLTLLNGRRLVYGGFSQAVDVSSIPLAAVSSVQIVPDGASASYGSDAVAGVVNILLKRDFDGLETSARVGSATEGGGFQQSYDATGGTKWNSGGLLISGQYQHQNAIASTQRDYTSYMSQPSDLIGGSGLYSTILSAHQDIGSEVTFAIDGLFSDRTTFINFAPMTSVTSFAGRTRTRDYVVAPSATVRLGGDWVGTISGNFGESRNNATTLSTTVETGALKSASTCDCNWATGSEFNLDGSLFNLAGGPAKLAVGAGYRENKYTSITYSSGARQGGARHSLFGYGELNLPFVSSENARPGLARLQLSAAARYENYNDFGDIVTPKFGIIYSPFDSIDLKGSWGKSFKAPTLLQEFQQNTLYLYPAASLGGTSLPKTATVLYDVGGSKDLKPERSESWSGTIDFHPSGVRGLHTTVTYFHVTYTDRVVSPLDPSAALSNPVYTDFVVLNPNLSEQDAARARAATFTSFAGVYDPANVVAIANNAYTNAARQLIQGVDLAPNYTFSWARGQMTLSGLASWLTSRQKTSSTGPWMQLAGTVYNPPKFRGRMGANWTGTTISASAYFNYIGSVHDDRLATQFDGESMSTVDLSIGAKLRTGRSESRDLELLFAVQNLLDKKPPFLRHPDNSYASYDSTNYSAIGRFVSFTVRKRW